MKYVILIHSDPRPWGHPTADHVAETQALPKEERDRMYEDFDSLLEELRANDELVGGEALGDPAASRLYRWRAGQPVVTDGPYSEAKEHFAGFFLIDVAGRERAEQVAERFAGPGETVELRPAWTGDDAP